MSTLKGNAVLAQSGGPTAVINSSACGVLDECFRHPNVIRQIFGANHGILGIVQEDLFDLGSEAPDTLSILRVTPSSTVGSCRYKIRDLTRDRDKFERMLAVFAAHDVRYFFTIGGDDSMGSADKVDKLAREKGYDLCVVGIPKTIENDLPITDHCPGYGSAAKYLATSVMEAGRDTDAMYTFDPVTIAEVMGRHTGWLAAATGLARRHDDEAPHLIYVPEIPFSEERFLADVREVHRRLGRVFIVVSEGLKNERGQYVSASTEVDALGQRQPGGAGEVLRQLLVRETGLKARYNKLSTCQRSALHFASRTDSDEAYRCGQEAVRQALAGTSGQMITLNRYGSEPYRVETGLAKLAEIAGSVKPLPRDFLNVAGTQITEGMRRYVTPLLLGEAPIRMGPDGLPIFARLERKPIARCLPPFVGKK